MIKNEYEDQVIALSKRTFDLEEEIERRKKDGNEELESIKLKMALLVGENENLKEKVEKILENKSNLENKKNYILKKKKKKKRAIKLLYYYLEILLNGSIIEDAFDSLENSSASLNRTISKIFKNKVN